VNRVAVIVPCFNEEHRLPVAEVERYLAASSDVGLVMVDDGSRDGTLAVLQGLAARHPGRVSVLHLDGNVGKAEAVRRGVLAALEADPAYVGYFDADLATPLEVADQFAALLDARPDIRMVMGARIALLGRHIARRAHRHYLGRVFATGASLVLGLPVYDTQCGAKLLRVEPGLASLFAQPFVSRWIFDVELIARHLQEPGRTGGQIYEFPLERWTDVGESKVRPTDFMRAFGELGRIFQSYRLASRFDPSLRLLAAPFVRYVGVGGLGTLVHYAVLTALVELMRVAPAQATVAGALAGAGVNYFLNYHFTFASAASHARTLPRFLTVAGLGVVANAYGMRFLTEALGMHYLLAQLGCTLLVLVLGFVLNRLWTFGAST
jgi:dolichyl-phosphate beta-glucosyltransferase